MLKKTFSNNEKATYYLTSVLIAVSCCIIFYPGIFSNDSFNQINQAITSRYNSWHPAIMAILMHYLYKPFGVGGIFLLHQVLYWLAWALFFDIVLGKRKKIYLITGFFTPFFLISLTVWKDTGMMISLFLSSTLIYYFFKYHKSFVLIPIFLLLAYAFNVRTNGFIIVGTLIFIFVSAYWFTSKTKVLASVIVGAISATLCSTLFFSLNSSINKYYEVEQVSALPSLVLYDAAGTFYNAELGRTPPPSWAEKNLKNSSSWISEYNEKVCSLCWTSNITCNGNPNMNSVYLTYWVKTILEHPVDYIKHRTAFISNLFGINFPTYYPYHSHKQQNSYEEQFHINHLGVVFLYPVYILSYLLSIFHLYQPALYVLLSIFCFLDSLKRFICKKDFSLDRILTLSLSGSSIISALSLAFLAVAADYRYMIWSVLGGFISMLITFKREDSTARFSPTL